MSYILSVLYTNADAMLYMLSILYTDADTMSIHILKLVLFDGVVMLMLQKSFRLLFI